MKRFWHKVKKGKKNECWEWHGGGRGAGYGAMKIDGKVIDAHRVSWELHFGKIPNGKFVCHKCDNRRCVNPNHLFLGTPKDNVLDAIKKNKFTQWNNPKGKFKNGVCNVTKKLSDEDVYHIRKEYQKGKTSYRKLAQKYNIDYTYVGEIIREEKRIKVPNSMVEC